SSLVLLKRHYFVRNGQTRQAQDYSACAVFCFRFGPIQHPAFSSVSRAPTVNALRRLPTDLSVQHISFDRMRVTLFRRAVATCAGRLDNQLVTGGQARDDLGLDRLRGSV